MKHHQGHDSDRGGLLQGGEGERKRVMKYRGRRRGNALGEGEEETRRLHWRYSEGNSHQGRQSPAECN